MTYLTLPKWLLILTLPMALLFCSCDRREDAAILAKAGQTTSTQLAEFYASLEQINSRSLEYLAFQDSLRDTGNPDGSATEAENSLIKELGALQSRRSLALQFGKTYASLAKLAETKAAEDITRDATKLSSEVRSLPALSSAPEGIDALVGAIAGNALQMAHDHDLNKAAGLSAVIVDDYRKIFAKEKPAYTSMLVDHKNKSASLIEVLLSQKIASADPLFEEILSFYGFNVIKKNETVNDPALRKASVAMIRARSLRLEVQASQTADSLEQSLAALARAHLDFAAKKKLNLQNLEKISTRTALLLETIQNLNGKKP